MKFGALQRKLSIYAWLRNAVTVILPRHGCHLLRSNLNALRIYSRWAEYSHISIFMRHFVCLLMKMQIWFALPISQLKLKQWAVFFLFQDYYSCEKEAKPVRTWNSLWILGSFFSISHLSLTLAGCVKCMKLHKNHIKCALNSTYLLRLHVPLCCRKITTRFDFDIVNNYSQYRCPCARVCFLFAFMMDTWMVVLSSINVQHSYKKYERLEWTIVSMPWNIQMGFACTNNWQQADVEQRKELTGKNRRNVIKS